MNQLNIAGSQSTPTIVGDREHGILSLSGDSYPENSFEFFGDVIAWIERYLAETSQPLRLELRLVYMNTSSVKAMMDIFDMLNDAHQAGREVSVRWLYDARNERVAELAEEFREDCEFPFVISADG
jgi:alpha-amylase/alpha-mannosidase (GH57 family)